MNKFLNLHLKAMEGRREIAGICIFKKPISSDLDGAVSLLSLQTCPSHCHRGHSTEHTVGWWPLQVLPEAHFGPWPLTQCGLLGGGPGSVPEPSPQAGVPGNPPLPWLNRETDRGTPEQPASQAE